MKAKHLTEDVMLELVGSRLSGEDRRVAEQHLAECAECREAYAEFQFVHSVIGRLAEVGYSEVLEEPAPDSTKRRRTEFAFPLGPVIAIASGCLVVLAVLFYPSAIPRANATELLASAVRHEDQSGAEAAAFQLQTGGKSCAGGRQDGELVSFERSLHCDRALQDVKATSWGHGNPLSAKSFKAWRDGLHRHQDRVTKEQTSWEIQTTTEEGSVRTASLEMRASDYRPTKLTLDFVDNEEVSISEALEALPPAPPAEVAAGSLPPQARYVDNPGDLLEVRAWATLHQLNADSGWEAVVERDGLQVRVKAFSDDQARRQQLRSEFTPYPAILVEIYSSSDHVDHKDVLPDRTSPAANAPGLAEGWLEQQFPSEARAEFKNNTLRLSQQILGRAFFLDKLRMRQTAIVHCSCAKDLAGIVEDEKRTLIGLQASLSLVLRPLIGSPLHSAGHPLSLADAINLDTSLEELLSGSTGWDQTAFDLRVQKVRDLLGANQLRRAGLSISN